MQFKSISINHLILIILDFEKQFKLSIDASDVGVGPFYIIKHIIKLRIFIFSRKVDTYQKHYSTIEKDCLTLMFELQHFDRDFYPTMHSILIYSWCVSLSCSLLSVFVCLANYVYRTSLLSILIAINNNILP